MWDGLEAPAMSETANNEGKKKRKTVKRERQITAIELYESNTLYYVRRTHTHTTLTRSFHAYMRPTRTRNFNYTKYLTEKRCYHTCDADGRLLQYSTLCYFKI